MSISNLNPFRLTRLYANAKASCDDVVNADLPVVEDSDDQDMVALNRRLKIQKDRLLTWGLEWTDENNRQGSNPKLDETFARAGLTENVASVMKTIGELLQETAQLSGNSPIQSTKGVVAWPSDFNDRKILSALEKTRYGELCSDLSTSIDILYDLSRARRAIQEGTYPQSITGAQVSATYPINQEKVIQPPPISKALYSSRSYSSSADTLVTPSRTSTERTLLVNEAPARLDRKSLVLEQEPPPAYGSVGNLSARLIGHLRRSVASGGFGAAAGRRQEMEPVLVEYASFDSAYKETGVKVPPTDKLDALMVYFAKCNALPEPSVSGTLNCLGYFDELSHSRYGIVYELPRTLRSGISDSARPRDLRPVTLLSLLQQTSRHPASSSGRGQTTIHPPPLEERFRMAYSIVRSFSRLHEENILHRDVNSNCILFFTKELQSMTAAAEHSVLDQYDLCTPYATSFDLFSEYSISSEAGEHAGGMLNIYNHPDVEQHKAYRIEHDVYSLGLILLEISLWTPLEELYKKRYSLKDFKQRLENTWLRRLASKCGTTYTRVVQECLNAASHRPATVAAGRVSVGQMYARMLGRLHRCCLMDETQPILQDSVVSSLQNSATLESMIQQGLPPSETQTRVGQWADTTRELTSAYPSDEPLQSVATNLTDESFVTGLDHLTRGSDVNQHNPHTLPVSIAEEIDEALSRKNSKASLSSRWPFSRHSSRPKREDSDNMSIISIKSKYLAAANIIQRAWRRRTQSLEFKEYKRKVTVIQQRWRKRNDAKSSADTAAISARTPTSSEETLDSTAQKSEAATGEKRGGQQSTKRKLRVQPVKLSAARLQEWHGILLPQLERIITKALKDSPETVSIDLLCIGETPIKAQPTIFITCSSVSRVRAALSRRLVYDSEVYGLKIRRGKVSRSKSSNKRRTRAAHLSMAADADTGSIPQNPFYQRRPLCGASIGAYVNGKHLPPVSYGGVVLLDGKPFGMTVHHLLDEQTDDEGSEADQDDGLEEEDDDDHDEENVFGSEQPNAARVVRSSGNARSDATWLTGMGAAPGMEFDEVNDSLSYDLEISDESCVSGDEEDEIFSDDESLVASLERAPTSSHASTEGDLQGIDPADSDSKPIFITQPAIDDVDEGFFPCEADKDEDHLASHTLGTVHASSGIRRWNREGVLHEIDWALLKLDPDRLQPFNLVQGGRKYLRQPNHGNYFHVKDDSTSVRSHRPSDSGIGSSRSSPNPFTESAAADRPALVLKPKLLEPVSRGSSFTSADDEYPTAIAPADELASLKVHCFGRTSGLSSGVIGPAMSSVRIYRRRSFARSWNIVGTFGVGGDSGAWVMENDNGRVVGHVLAWGQGQKGGVALTYFCPMQILLEDMVRALDVEVIGLPGGGDIVRKRHALRSSFDNEFPTAVKGSETESEDSTSGMDGLGLEDLNMNEMSGGVTHSGHMEPQASLQKENATTQQTSKSVYSARKSRAQRGTSTRLTALKTENGNQKRIDSRSNVLDRSPPTLLA